MYNRTISSKLPYRINRVAKNRCTNDNIIRYSKLHETKKQLNSLYYSCRPLTATELCTLVKHRRIQLSTIESGIELYVYPELWEGVDNMTWSGLSDMLNAWHAGDQIRKHSTTISDNDDISIIPIYVPNCIKYCDSDVSNISNDYIDIIDVSSF